MRHHTIIQQISISLLLLQVCQGVIAASAEGQLGEGMVNPGYHEQPSWFKSSFMDFKDDIEEAAAKEKRLILYFYQDGCPYCSKLLRDNFGQRRIAKKTRQHFDVIAINMWGDRDITWVDGTGAREKLFAARMKVMFTPTMLFLDEKGNIALRVNGYYAPDKFDAALDYVRLHQEKKIAFREFYQQRNPIKASGKLHSQPFLEKPPYNLVNLTDKNDKPILVLFEQHQCKECDELHKDIFKREDTLLQLDGFNVIRLDMWSDEKLVVFDGRRTTARKWAKDLKVQYAPSMVFFDPRGKEVIRTEAYLKSFHLQSVMDYVATGAYRGQPSFQRFISDRADRLEKQGVHVDLMK
ncbi:MAG: thioredoxin fold domain-containing protein [Gammaproteobacteria bacterium]|nr:thioredoxin fold domain-containing protein [Gammaproteobacteria bacterium]